MAGDIDKLIVFIKDHYPFKEGVYPELKGASEQEKLVFAIRHLALHFSKTAGKIASVSENTGHGEEVDIEAVQENIPRALINTLRLAELVGMTEQDLIKAVEEKYDDQIS